MGSGCLDGDDSDVWDFSICLQFYMEGWTHDTKRLQLDVPRIQKGFGQSWGLLHTTRNFPRDGNDTRVWKRFLQHDTVQMKASKAQSHLYAGNSSKLDPSCSQEYLYILYYLALPRFTTLAPWAAWAACDWIAAAVGEAPSNMCKDVRKRAAPWNPFISAPLGSLVHCLTCPRLQRKSQQASPDHHTVVGLKRQLGPEKTEDVPRSSKI